MCGFPLVEVLYRIVLEKILNCTIRAIIFAEKNKERRENFMKYKSIFCMFALISLIATMSFTMPVRAQPNGPKTSNMLIHIYATDVAEFAAFESATGEDAIDFVDWPLPKDKVDLWSGMDSIQLRDYSDIGHYEIDINNQRWPTGVTEPREKDLVTDSWKHYYDETSVWDVKAREFRKAIAYLSDKEGWVTRILKGYGYSQHTDIPYPALAGYTDYTTLRTKGLIYIYNPVTAAAILDAAGFTQGTTSNPDYDPDTPGSAPYLRTDPRYGGDLQELQFYIRMDDVLRRDVGRELTAQLRKAGIPVNPIETDRTVCYNNAMVIYDYHLYTGGWSLSADAPDSLHFLFHSSQYWGGTETSYFGGTGWSANYAGFADHEYDTWAHQAKFGSTFDAVKTAGLNAQERAAELCHTVPAYARAAVSAFKTGWEGVVNFRGVGPYNYYTWLNSKNTVDTPENPADDEIDWGFKSTLSGPNPVTSEWVWDDYVSGLIYDTLLGRNPYDLSMDYGIMAESWSTGLWEPGKMYALFTLRAGNTFHNGDPVTPDDVKFSIEFVKACGPGVAWVYSDLVSIDRVDTKQDDNTLGDLDVKVYFDSESYWAVHWAGFRYILNHNIWMRANDNLGWGYERGMTDYNEFANRMDVREYSPWLYDGDGDGIKDFQEDGCGPWVFTGYAPSGPISAATSLSFAANTNFVLSQTAISDFLSWAFHMIGDVDEDGDIDGADGYAIQKALGTDTSFPWGTGWDQYNAATDINVGTWDMVNHAPLTVGDEYIDVYDLGKLGLNFGGLP